MCLAGGAAVPGAAASQAVGLSGAGALALLLAFGGAWLAALGGFSVTPPMDNIEQLVWLHALEWGYHKHPPLPTWIIAAGAALVGPEPWLSYVLGGLFTLASMLLLWHLVRELRGGAWATLVLLGALCITFYNGRLYYYNHNVVMMPCVAGMVWLLWRVTRRPSLAVWATIGALGALGMLSKYQTVVAIVCVGLWWLHLRGWRHPLHRRGLGLAAVIGLLMLAPHLAWLAAHDWAPLAYAQESSVGADLGAGARASLAVRWSADWLLSRTLPAWLLIGAVLIASRAGRHDGGGTPPVVDAPADREARAYLLLWGFGPLLLMLALGLVWGVELQMQWGTAFMLWTVPAVLELVGRAGGRLAQGAGCAWRRRVSSSSSC
ncbi:MAG: glycosyltransferase family 39 protein [Burkholderiales bacterium]|nr:glycosyltransferase family 39 protein [Burkholderiales bacterium]